MKSDYREMYNLSVAVAQTYYVGDGQWLVHNCDEFDIIPYSRSLADINRARKAQGLEPLEKHHGVLNEWAHVHLGSLGYTKGAAPTIALTESQHAATKEVYREWLRENYGRPVGVSPDWAKMDVRTTQELTQKMFDAAKIPAEVQRQYFAEWNKYIDGLK